MTTSTKLQDGWTDTRQTAKERLRAVYRPIMAFAVGAAVTLAALLLAIQVGGRLEDLAETGVTRFMGLIVVSMGMQFILKGLRRRPTMSELARVG